FAEGGGLVVGGKRVEEALGNGGSVGTDDGLGVFRRVVAERVEDEFGALVELRPEVESGVGGEGLEDLAPGGAVHLGRDGLGEAAVGSEFAGGDEGAGAVLGGGAQVGEVHARGGVHE